MRKEPSLSSGNRLIDFGCRDWSREHGSRMNSQAVKKDRFAHVCFPVSTYEPYVALAERLNRLTPGSHEKRSFFVNSGAEAVENAIKAARFFTGRPAVICFEHGFHQPYQPRHGAHAQKVMPYKKGFGRSTGGDPYCYRCEDGPDGGRVCRMAPS